MTREKLYIMTVVCVLMLFRLNIGYAQGMFFNVSSSGDIVLNISTNIPNQTYANAGIKILNTDVYTLSGVGSDCILNNKGYCVFSISANEVKSINLTGMRGGTVNFVLCLNSSANLACQNYSVDIDELLNFSGPRTDLTESGVLAGGFSICYNEFYNSILGASGGNVKTPCTEDILLVSCRPVGASSLTVSAMALRTEVFFDSGGGLTDSHLSNGSQWYFSNNMSFGFANGGDPVRRQNSDTQTINPELRLSWPTSNVGSGGYRCGETLFLNNSTTWEKLVYQRNGSL